MKTRDAVLRMSFLYIAATLMAVYRNTNNSTATAFGVLFTIATAALITGILISEGDK